MKILFVTEYFPSDGITGGVEARTYYLSKYLAENHDVSVICSRQKGQPVESEVNDCKIYRVGKTHPYSHKGSILTRLSFTKSAIEKGRELDADIVDGQNFLTYLPAHKIGRESNAIKIATYHETWLGKWIKHKGLVTGIGGEYWERLALNKKWDRIISVSKFTKDKLIKHGVNPEIIKVVPNGVNTSEFQKIKIEKNEKPTICAVSRLTEKKRIDIVMRAIEKVSEKIPDIKLRIVGDGPKYEELKKLSRELDAVIELLGYLPDKKDVIKIMKSSHLLVSASILEGFGITLLESAASGTPFIVSDIEPHIEVTKDGKGGLIFNQDNLTDLKDKILNILQDKELYKEKKRECQVLSREYDWSNIVKDIESCYESLIC